MNVTYQTTVDEAYYKAALDRYRQQRSHRRRAAVMIALMASIIGGVTIYAWLVHARWLLIPALASEGGVLGGLLGAVIGARVALARQLRRLRGRPDFGIEVTTVLSETGLAISAGKTDAQLGWLTFTRVVRFEDGFLFLRGCELRWLPDAALRDSTADVAKSFITSKIAVVGQPSRTDV